MHALNAVTILLADSPTCKHYDLDEHGKLVKASSANNAVGTAHSVQAPDVHAFAEILKDVTSEDRKVLVPGHFLGNDDAETFDIVTERKLAHRSALAVGSPELAGVLNINGQRLAARLKRSIEPCRWVLLDADSPPGMSTDWAELDLAGRLALFEQILPGISRCERIELRSSSSRVVAPGATPGLRTHGWMALSNTEMIDVMRVHARVAAQLAGLGFKSPRRSRKTGEIIGHNDLTLLDLSVWIVGRLVFCSAPQISEAMVKAGWTVADAGIMIVNEGAGPLDISGLAVPTEERLAAYHKATGEQLKIGRNGTSVAVRSRGLLTADTEIIVKRRIARFQSITAWMRANSVDHLRCEAPFRESYSEAAFIGRDRQGEFFVHDSGTSTSYWTEPPKTPVEKIAGRTTDGLLDRTLPPRGWLLGNFICRKFVGGMVSPGGVGKTAIEVVFALMMATGRKLVPNITVWGTWKVLLLMLDDDDDEADRRVQAAMKYHGISEEEVAGRLVYYTVSRDKLIVRDPQHPEILQPGPLLQSLERTIVEDGFDAVLIDPLINVANVKENSNEEMNYLIDQVAGLTQRLDIGAHVNHHTRKGGGEPGDQDKARGAGAFVNRGRLFYDLNPMSEDDARLYDIPLRERRRYVSLVRSKDNLTVGDEERWFKLEGQDLGNATDLYPAGDNVQTIVGWKAPDAFEGLSAPLIDEIVDKLEAGPEPGRHYSGQAQAHQRGAWKVVVQVTGKPEPQAKSIIAAWIRSGFLIDDEYTYTRSDGKGTRTESGLRVRPGPRPGRAI